MRTSIKSVLFVAALVSFSGAASAECYKVTGKGTGVTPDIAKFMSNKALKDSITNRGLKPAGTEATSCDSSMVVVSNCTSTQRACK